MWIVQLALRRPYTFLVLAIVITLLGVFSILRTPTDIFPNIRIPVVATIWKYAGLSPEEMANRIVLGTERNAQTTVNDVEHTESQSLTGVSVVKYFFQPNVDEELAYAQITGVSQTQLRSAPPGTTPPFILAFNASSVPILQLALSSEKLSEAQLFDLGNNVIRVGLGTVQGASMPYPYGGLQRQVQVDLDPNALRAQGRFEEALVEFRKGHELGSKQLGWPYPSVRWVRECEARVAAGYSDRGIALRKQQKLDEAVVTVEECFANRQARPGTDHTHASRGYPALLTGLKKAS